MSAEPTYSYEDRIVVDPKIMLGKPTIRGPASPSIWCWSSFHTISTLASSTPPILG
jgi:hypothetical protein